MESQRHADDWLFALAGLRQGILAAPQLELMSAEEVRLPLEQELVQRGLLTRAARAAVRACAGALLAEWGEPERAIWQLVGDQPESERMRSQLPDSAQKAFDRLRQICGSRFADGGDDTRQWRCSLRQLRPYARGGMGTVSTAADFALNRRVAVKELAPHCVHDPQARLRFLREAEVTGMLEHPGVVPIYSLGSQPEGPPFYTMRFVEGRTLQEAIRTLHAGSSPDRHLFQSREFRKLLQHFLDVCNTIEYAHSRGVVHRDLKPANIMLGQFGETLTLDWGLARVYQAPPPDSSPACSGGEPLADIRASDSLKTVHGHMLGTPVYASPEQLRGEHDSLGPATDIYSLGVILFLILTGQIPYKDVSASEVVLATLEGKRLDVRDVNRFVPAPLAAICRKALAQDPVDRYRSARVLAEDVERWRANESVLAHRETVVQHVARWLRRNRRWAISGLVALMAVAVVSTAAAITAFTYWKDARTAGILADRARSQAEEQRDLALHNAHLTRLGMYNTQLKRVEDLYLRRPFEAAHLLHDNQHCPPGLREFTWGHLQTLLSQLGDRAKMHHEGLTDFDLPASGARLFSVGESTNLLTWDTNTGQPLEHFPVRAAGSGAVACMLSGDVVAFAREETRVCVLSRSEAARTIESPDLGSPVVELAFSQSGTRLAVGTSSGRVLLYDWPAGDLQEPRRMFDIDERSAISQLEFLGTDRYLLVGAGLDSLRLRLLDLDGEPPAALPATAGAFDNVAVLACAQHAPMLATWSPQRTAVLVWTHEPESDEPFQLIRVLPAEHVTALGLTADGHYLVLGDRSGSLTILEGDHIITTFAAHPTSISGIKSAAEAGILASTDRDGTIRVWDFAQLLRSSRNHSCQTVRSPASDSDARAVLCLASSTDGNLLALAGQTDGVELWDTEPWRTRGRASAHDYDVTLLRVSPDQRWLASRCDIGQLIVWELAAGKQAAQLQSLDVERFEFAPDSSTLSLLMRDGSVRSWDFRTHPHPGQVTEVVQVIPATAEHEHACTIPLGSTPRWLSLAFGEDQFRILSGSPVQPLHSFQLRGRVETGRDFPAAVSACGEYVAIQTRDQCELWNVATGKRTLLLDKVPDTDYFLRFSPDSKTFVSLLCRAVDRQQAEVRLLFWDPATGHQRFQRTVGSTPIGAVEFLGDSSALVIADMAGSVVALNSISPSQPSTVTATPN